MPKKKSKGTVKKQRGGMTPANPNVNVPPGGGYGRRLAQGLGGMGMYGRAGSPGGWGAERPTGGATYGGSGAGAATGRGAGQRELAAQYQGMLGAGIGARGRPTGPPRRPPPPIRPGYNVGGPVPETNASLAGKGYQGGGAFMPPSRPRIQDFMGGVAGGPPGRRPTLGPQPRRRRGRGRGGRDV